MLVKNETSKKIIARYAIPCKSIVSQTLGLMGFTKIDPLVFMFKEEKRHSFHMFFVFASIDMIFLDRNKQIVELKENFKPFHTYNPINKTQYVLELPKGAILESKSKLGDTVSFK